MSRVYAVTPDGSSVPCERIRCRNEDQELQAILLRNLDLLPGDQIDPANPRQWLLVKREMPVPDPNTGEDRWSIDFLLADQDGIPTFVECKRFMDTRARREVVGQVLEYVANGHFYWTKELMRDFAEAAAQETGRTLDDAVRSIAPGIETPDLFFERMQENLREAQVRIVFFMEESPMELRSLVDFLNKQMERSEVLLVEARQYRINGRDDRVVVPTLFGYTEQARQVKRTVTVNTAAERTERRKWDEATFFADAQSKLKTEQFRLVSQLYQQCLSDGCKIRWGAGKANGSFIVCEPALASKSCFSLTSSGHLCLSFASLKGDDHLDQARQRFATLFRERTSLRIPADVANAWPTYPIDTWGSQSKQVLDVLHTFTTEARKVEL